jgi:hypothetical protein
MPLLPASTIFTEADATTPIIIRRITAIRTAFIGPMFTLTLGD